MQRLTINPSAVLDPGCILHTFNVPVGNNWDGQRILDLPDGGQADRSTPFLVLCATVDAEEGCTCCLHLPSQLHCLPVDKPLLDDTNILINSIGFHLIIGCVFNLRVSLSLYIEQTFETPYTVLANLTSWKILILTETVKCDGSDRLTWATMSARRCGRWRRQEP